MMTLLRILVSLGVWVAMPAAAPAAMATSARPPRPNVVMIVIESLRADHVGCYGYARPTTPTLDALASNGVRCAHVSATASWTKPATMSLLTGQYPSTHGAVDFEHGLVQGMPTLAVTLTNAGYATAGFTANPMMHGRFGFGRGFGLYDDFTLIFGVNDAALIGEDAPDSGARATGPETTHLALGWLDRRDRSKPFFLFVFYFDPHYDYAPLPPYDELFTDPDYAGPANGRGIPTIKPGQYNAADRAQTIALYDGEVRQTDAQIADLLAGLRGRGLNTNTLVVAVGDHGEEFWEHGRTAHGNSLYDELIRVPLIWNWPERIAAGRSLAAPVSQVDVMPTILEAAGVDIPGALAGQSLWKALQPGNAPMPPVDRPLFMELTLGSAIFRGVRLGDLKAILGGEHGHCQFFDLATDPREERDIFGSPGACRFAALDTALEGFLARTNVATKNAAAALDPRLLHQLKSLGYVK